MFRKRTSWCWNIRPEIPTPAVKHHTVMADGTYMSHDWCLIVAVDGETGEALGFQWCSHESVLLQCLFDRFGSVFPQCGLMVFPGVVIVSR